MTTKKDYGGRAMRVLLTITRLLGGTSHCSTYRLDALVPLADVDESHPRDHVVVLTKNGSVPPREFVRFDYATRPPALLVMEPGEERFSAAVAHDRMMSRLVIDQVSGLFSEFKRANILVNLLPQFVGPISGTPLANSEIWLTYDPETRQLVVPPGDSGPSHAPPDESELDERDCRVRRLVLAKVADLDHEIGELREQIAVVMLRRTLLVEAALENQWHRLRGVISDSDIESLCEYDPVGLFDDDHEQLF